jgi:hypothetical protein
MSSQVRSLKAVKPTEIAPVRPKILIYGKYGSGKTHASLDFPSCYYVDSEGGAKQDQYRKKLIASGGVYFGPEQGSRDFAAVVEEVKTLATVKHPYKTLIIDSLSAIYNSAISDEAERLGSKDAFGASKKPATRLTMQLLNWVNRADMNVVLIAHEKAEWGMANGSREEIGKTFDAFEKVGYELDLCLNILNPGPNVRIARIVKSRFDSFPMGETFPWSFAEFASRYGEDIIAKEAAPIVLATAEQVKELTFILEERKDGEDLKAKWFKAANAESLEELTTEQAAKCIAALSKKETK